MTGETISKVEAAVNESPLRSIEASRQYLGGISRAKLYEMLGDLDTVKIGGRRMVTRASLDRLIERSRV